MTRKKGACRFFKKGTCNKGNQCKMAHGARKASPVAGGGEADSVLDDEATLAGEAQRQRGSDGDAAHGEELVLRDRLWEWVHANWEIFDAFGSCHVTQLLRAFNGFKQHLPEGFLPQGKPEVQEMYKWLGTVVGLETFMDRDGRRSFRIMEHAFGRYEKGHEAGRYSSFGEVGRDIGVEGAAHKGYEAMARVAELPHVIATGRLTSGDSFQGGRGQAAPVRNEREELVLRDRLGERRGQAAPVRKKHRTH
jgi:hypothetical protein